MKAYSYLFFLGLYFLTSCSNRSRQEDPIPTHYTFTVYSESLGEERTINVWVPSDYRSNTDSLPVLYMPDGGIGEDFPHIANTLSELVDSAKILPIILVGIENTERRRDLTGTTSVKEDKEIAPVVGGSEAFRIFINDELVHEITNRYRTTAVKGIIGESLAGLFVTETFLLRPEMFDFYIAFDPSLWWNDEYLIKTGSEHLSKFPSRQKTFWFASSQNKTIAETVDKLAIALENNKSPFITWQYTQEKKELHHTIFRATKVKALIWTLNNLPSGNDASGTPQ